MSNPSVTYQFVNGQTSDGPQVSQNFTDLINSLTDGTKTLTVAQIIAPIHSSASTLTFQTNGASSAITIDATQIVTVTVGAQFLTSGGTPTTLNYYEEGTFTANFNQSAGAGGAGTSFTVPFVRVGKVVTLLFPNMNGMTAGATTASFATVGATVPSRLRPVTAGINAMVVGHVNGADVATPLQINVGTAGAISIFRDGGNVTTFTSAAISGPYACAVTYTIQ